MRIFWILLFLLVFACNRKATGVVARDVTTPISPKPNPTSPVADPQACEWISVRSDKDGDGFGTKPTSSFCRSNETEADFKEIHLVPAKDGDTIDNCDENADLTDQQTLYWDRDSDAYASLKSRLSCDKPKADEIADKDRLGSDDCDDQANKFQNVKAFRDADADKVGSSESKTICVGKDGTADEALQGYIVDDSEKRLVDACDSIPLKYQLVDVFTDSDADGYAAPPFSRICIGADGVKDELMQGKVLDTAKLGFDACDNDATAFQNITAYHDGDKDHWSKGNPTFVCVDARGTTDPRLGQLLPAASRLGEDCNDENPELNLASIVWRDKDGDQIGAGQVLLLCTQQSREELMSLGFAPVGYDVDDADSLIQEDSDADSDDFLLFALEPF